MTTYDYGCECGKIATSDRPDAVMYCAAGHLYQFLWANDDEEDDDVNAPTAMTDVNNNNIITTTNNNNASSSTSFNPFLVPLDASAFPSSGGTLAQCSSSKSSGEKEQKHDEEEEPDLSCCAKVRGLLAKLNGVEVHPVGIMIRMIFSTLPTLKAGKKTMPIIAFDISFLWFCRSLGNCTQSPDAMALLSYAEQWNSRPDPKDVDPNTYSVASCHPSAEQLGRLIGNGVLGEAGTLGLTRSEAKAMTPHQDNCALLCESINTTARGIWWVSHCGHSFNVIRRGAGVEVIDAFANDRGLGLWTLTPEELGGMQGPHLPPPKRIHTVAEVIALLQQLVHDNLEERYKAQTALVNYQYETEHGADRLPGAAFGFRGYPLKSDAGILASLASHFFHAAARWKMQSRNL